MRLLSKFLSICIATVCLSNELHNLHAKKKVVIDTDAGTDDFLAISYLLTRPEISIEAITIVHGLGHVPNGYRNMKCLLQTIGRLDIPVFTGEEESLLNKRTFPDAWRDGADTVFEKLPQCDDIISNTSNTSDITAVDYLTTRILDIDSPFILLVLGPMTNVALALKNIQESHTLSTTIDTTTTTTTLTTPIPTGLQEVAIMGGAFQVEGNILYTDVNGYNPDAEWNIFCDPEAAEIYANASKYFSFQTAWVGLDATNHVPITIDNMRQFNIYHDEDRLNWLGQIALKLLNFSLDQIEKGEFYAWDPLAAVYITHKNVVTLRPAESVEVLVREPDVGSTRVVKWYDYRHSCHHPDSLHSHTTTTTPTTPPTSNSHNGDGTSTAESAHSIQDTHSNTIDKKFEHLDEQNDMLHINTHTHPHTATTTATVTTTSTQPHHSEQHNCKINNDYHLSQVNEIAISANRDLFDELFFSAYLK